MIVKQPNGLFAYWDNATEIFLIYNQSELMIRNYCQQRQGYSVKAVDYLLIISRHALLSYYEACLFRLRERGVSKTSLDNFHQECSQK